MLKAGEDHSILTVPFLASQWLSGVKEDRTEHLPTVLALIPSLILVCKVPVPVVIPEKPAEAYNGAESAPPAYSGKVAIKWIGHLPERVLQDSAHMLLSSSICIVRNMLTVECQ